MLAFLRFIVSSLGLGKNKWQVNVHLSLDSQYHIRLSGLCLFLSTGWGAVYPTDRWSESRNECSSFDHLCNLTVFILEIISKLCDTWELWVQVSGVEQVWCSEFGNDTHRVKGAEDRAWLFNCISRVGRRLHRLCTLWSWWASFTGCTAEMLPGIHFFSQVTSVLLLGCRASCTTPPSLSVQCHTCRADLKEKGEIC